MSTIGAQTATLARPQHKRTRAPGAGFPGRTAVIWTVSLVIGLGGWWLVSALMGPYVMASPAVTVAAIGELIERGTLFESIGASLSRILTGWAIGVVIGAPLGILMGRSRIVRDFLDPYIEILRFIPAIALVTLMIVWFGIGETSKVMLIIYTSIFVVVISTCEATKSISQDKVLAARSLGANSFQVAKTVVLPSSVPGIVTGARLAMGNSFLTIISAEMVAAQHGLGTLIWTSYSFGRIDWIFAGIAVLGALGFICDRIVRVIAGKTLAKYGVK